MQGNINIPDSTITTNLSFRQLVLMNMQQLTNFPYIEKDFDALTDYELLCLVVKFLNDVIANQNEQNDSITRMYESFLALQTYVNNTKDTLEDAFNELDDYVRNYFDNLDVQEEINNKLDQMLEDGVLEQIIEQFIKSTALWCFDNVASMKQATNLINGSYAKTLGYYSVNDDGGATYKIRTITNDDTIDDFLLVELSDETLVAELIIENYITPEMAGCYGDNTHDDTINLQKAINSNYQIYTKNQYKISDTINIKNSFEMESTSFIHLTSDFSNDKLGVAIANTTNQQINKSYKINVNANGYGICGIGLGRPKKCNCKFYVINAGINGINMNYFNLTGNNENKFECHVNGNSSGTTEKGIIVNCYDSTFSDIITMDCETGVYLDSGQLTANYIHSWLSSDVMSTLWDTSCVLNSSGAYDCYINWFYQDTVKYGITGSNGFKGQINDFECNCINDSTYYNAQKNINITGSVGITLIVNNFSNDKLKYHLLNYTLPTSKVNVFGVIGRNGPNPYGQESNTHTTFTDANDAPQLGSKYVDHSTLNLPLDQNGVLESEVKGNLVIQRFYSINIVNEYLGSKRYHERYRKLGSDTWTNWYEYKTSTTQ